MRDRDFTGAALTILLILSACPAVIAQKKSLPPATPSALESSRPASEIVGQRIIFADGATLDVDDTWKQGDTVWYRVHGTSQSVNRTVLKIENRYKEAPPSDKTAPATKTVEPKAAPVVPTTWIYLVDGARLRVDEVREVADGAWYNRDKVTVFLAKERIARIERQSDTLVAREKTGNCMAGHPEML